MNLEPSTILTGGIVAAIAAGWSQVKQFLGYISGLLIVQARMDTNVASTVVMYLKMDEQNILLPSGRFQILGRWLNTRSHGICLVPFKMTEALSIYLWHRWKPITINIGSDGSTLYGIRGLVSPEELVRESLRFNSVLEKRVEDQQSRFFIYQVVGAEKGTWARGSGRRDNSSSEGPVSSDQVSAMPSWATNPRPGIDPSFMYSREDLVLLDKIVPSGRFYDDTIHALLKEVNIWMSMKSWYEERGIPWRRGWLFKGRPGTGKTALAVTIATKMGLPIYTFSLATLSDQEMTTSWRTMSAPCIALMEDIDTVFEGRSNTTEHNALSFECVLNLLSGVEGAEGILTIITTNRPETLDAALAQSEVVDGEDISSRPGRIDRIIEIGNVSEGVRVHMVRHILRDWPQVWDDFVARGGGMTVVQFQELCVRYALARMEETYKEIT